MSESEKKKREREKRKLKDKAHKAANLLGSQKDEECLAYISSLGDDALRNLLIYETKINCLSNLERHQEALALIGEGELHGHQRNSLSFPTRLCEAVSNFGVSNFRVAHDKFNNLDLKGKDENTLNYCDGYMKAILDQIGNQLEEDAKKKGEKLMEDIEVKKPLTTSNDKPSTSDVTQKTPELLCSHNISFVMDKLDEHSFLGYMKIGDRSFRKALIILNERQLKHLNESSHEACIEMEGSTFLLKSEFTVDSSSLSRRLSVVDPVTPIKVFFKQKLNDFNKSLSALSGDHREEWWKFIRECFHTIFREIICGLFDIHSAQKVCGDLDRSIYITQGGRARIFYDGGINFSDTEAQKDVDDLLSIMESIITLISPRTKSGKHVWLLQEFEDNYKLPKELRHFFQKLENIKVASHRIPTTWLIDHPYLWPFGHQFYFIRMLIEKLKEGLIEETSFVLYLSSCDGLNGWKDRAFLDKLLSEIYKHNGNTHYLYGSEARAINFVHAVMSHANDFKYEWLRGSKQLNRVDIVQRLAPVFPTVYTDLYDAIYEYASLECDHGLLWQALKSFSSCRRQTW